MTVAIELLLLFLGGVVLGLVVSQVLGRQGRAERATTVDARPTVKLTRVSRSAEGYEETRLAINNRTILVASNNALRLAAYAQEVEQLEEVAAQIAQALGVNVELSRVGPKPSQAEQPVAVRDLPRRESAEE